MGSSCTVNVVLDLAVRKPVFLVAATSFVEVSRKRAGVVTEDASQMEATQEFLQLSSTEDATLAR